MHIVKECLKRIDAYHNGENDAKNGLIYNSTKVPKSCRNAYKNGYIQGQLFKKSLKK